MFHGGHWNGRRQWGNQSGGHVMTNLGLALEDSIARYAGMPSLGAKSIPKSRPYHTRMATSTKSPNDLLKSIATLRGYCCRVFDHKLLPHQASMPFVSWAHKISNQRWVSTLIHHWSLSVISLFRMWNQDGSNDRFLCFADRSCWLSFSIRRRFYDASEDLAALQQHAANNCQGSDKKTRKDLWHPLAASPKRCCKIAIRLPYPIHSKMI